MDVQTAKLEEIAGLTASEARDALASRVVEDAKRRCDVSRCGRLEERAREEGEQRARKIVAIAIQRVASEETSENSMSVVTLPNDEMKGRIIGREGRNIRAFEAATGTSLLIDDTPRNGGAFLLRPDQPGGGQLTLEKLVGDGRIQPARIEEMYERTSKEVDVRSGKRGSGRLSRPASPTSTPRC